MSGSEENSSYDGLWTPVISHIWLEDSEMQISFFKKKATFTLLDTVFFWGASGVSAVNWTKSPNLRCEWTCDWQREREKDVVVEVHHTFRSSQRWKSDAFGFSPGMGRGPTWRRSRRWHGCLGTIHTRTLDQGEKTRPKTSNKCKAAKKEQTRWFQIQSNKPGLELIQILCYDSNYLIFPDF